MTKTFAICLMMVVGVFLLSLVIEQPSYISDHNAFLKDFIGANLLNVLGVILAITLASSAQLHLEFNKAEERYGRKGLHRSRNGVRGATFGLIGLFVVAVIVLICKPVMTSADQGQAFCNAIEIFILFMNVILLVELTQAAFSIRANVQE